VGFHGLSLYKSRLQPHIQGYGKPAFFYTDDAPVENSVGKKLLKLAAEIVLTKASRNQMSAEEIERALINAYNTLFRMRQVRGR
jgi:hypothetical protein